MNTEEHTSHPQATNNTESDSLTFEDSIDSLEQLVEQMEHGKLSLEDSLSLFEKGIQLTRSCQNKLNDAEQKVSLLTDSAMGDED